MKSSSVELALSAYGKALQPPSFLQIYGHVQHERSHSGLLGWLLSPEGFHGLGTKPLELFIQAIQNLSKKPEDACPLSSWKNFETLLDIDSACVIPSDTRPKEKKVGDGRLDCFVSGKINGKTFALLIEQKTTSSFREDQCFNYAEWLYGSSEWEIKIPIALIPEWKVKSSSKQTCGDARWHLMTYEMLYEGVLRPLLQKPGLDARIKVYLEDYLASLRTVVSGRSLIRNAKAKALRAELMNLYPEQAQRVQAIDETVGLCVGRRKEEYFIKIQLNDGQIEEISGEKRDIYQGVINLVAKNWALFDAVKLSMPYHLYGVQSNREMLSRDKLDDKAISAQTDDGKVLYLMSDIPGRPNNVYRWIDILIGEVGWERILE